jgi:hypothetical protein
MGQRKNFYTVFTLESQDWIRHLQFRCETNETSMMFISINFYYIYTIPRIGTWSVWNCPMVEHDIVVCISYFKGIMSKLMIKFWVCQKCGRLKDDNKKSLQVLQNSYEHTRYDNNYKIKLLCCSCTYVIIITSLVIMIVFSANFFQAFFF